MPAFCGSCGAQSEGGAFCTVCGTRHEDAPSVDSPTEALTAAPEPDPVAPSQPPRTLAAAPTPSPAPGTPAAPTWQQHAPGSFQAPAPASPAAPRQPVANPFVGVPVSDYVRDAAAAILLFAAIAKPWDFDGDASDHWWVVLSLLVSVASLAVPYVAKTGAIPTLGRDQALLVKILLNVPILVSVLATVVNELVHVTDDFEGGIGSGAAIAFAGSVLALQPRTADEDVAHRDDHRWWTATTVLGIVALALPVLTFVAYTLEDVTGDATLFDEVVTFLGYLLLLLVLHLVMLGRPLANLIRGQYAGAIVLATVGFTYLVVDLLASDDGDGLFAGFSIERWNYPGSGILAVGAAAALTVSRPTLRITAPQHRLHGWLLTARSALHLTAVGSVVFAVVLVLRMVDDEEVSAALIASIVLLALGAVVSMLGASMLGGSTLHRPNFVVAVSASLVIGVVVTAVLKNSDRGYQLLPMTAPFLLSLPVLAILALTVPASVRTAYGPLIPERQPPGGYSPPPPGQGQQQTPHQPPPPAPPAG